MDGTLIICSLFMYKCFEIKVKFKTFSFHFSLNHPTIFYLIRFCLFCSFITLNNSQTCVFDSYASKISSANNPSRALHFSSFQSRSFFSIPTFSARKTERGQLECTKLPLKRKAQGNEYMKEALFNLLDVLSFRRIIREALTSSFFRL